MKVIGPNLEGYPHEMTHRQFAGLEDAVVGYVRYDETQEIPDILSQPTYMVSEAIKKGGTTIKSFTSSEGVHGLFQNKLLVHGKKERN